VSGSITQRGAHRGFAEGRAAGRQDEAEAAYREGLTGAAEPDVHTRLLVQLGNCVPAGPERDGLLREAVELRGNLVASATAMILLRRSAP